MRLGRMLILIALLLILILGAIFVATNLLGGGRFGSDTTEEEQPMQSVIALSRSVKAGERITTDKVRDLEIPLVGFDESMFTIKSQVTDLYARSNLSAGTVLENDMLIDDPSNLINEMHSEHASLIAPGMVAVAVPINRFSSLAYGIATGDHVNIIATMAFIDLDNQFQTALPNYTGAVLAPGQNMVVTLNKEHGTIGLVDETGVLSDAETDVLTGEFWNNLVAQSASGEFVSPQGRGELDSSLNQPFYLVPGEPLQRPRVVSQTVMFNKLVLHVGDFSILDEQGNEVEPVTAEDVDAEAQAESEANQDGQENEIKPNVPDIVTLIVSPQEAVTLNYLIYTGAQLTLALRSPMDEATSPTDAVSIQYLLDTYRIPVPVKVPYGFEPAAYRLAPPVLENDMP